MNNIIVAECVQAQKKNVKTFARAEKKRSRVKETCTFSKWQSVCKRREKTWQNVHVRRKNVAELKKHAHFQNGSENNIVAECVQAQKKNVKTFARAEKKHSRVKKNMRLFKWLSE